MIMKDYATFKDSVKDVSWWERRRVRKEIQRAAKERESSKIKFKIN